MKVSLTSARGKPVARSAAHYLQTFFISLTPFFIATVEDKKLNCIDVKFRLYRLAPYDMVFVPQATQPEHDSQEAAHARFRDYPQQILNRDN